MGKKHNLKYRQTFALACPGIFFTLSFWSLGLLLGTSIYFLISGPSSSQSTFISNLVKSIPLSSMNAYDSPQCPEGSRLLFTFNLPGISDKSCFRSIDYSPYIEISTSWWKCESGLFTGFQGFQNTSTSTIWNLGKKFICVKDVDINIEDFEYVEKSTAVVEKSAFRRVKIFLYETYGL